MYGPIRVAISRPGLAQTRPKARRTPTPARDSRRSHRLTITALTGASRRAADGSARRVRVSRTRTDASWRAANYLSVGQLYLYRNPLLREPLQLKHVKPLIVGHWGTTPGQNFIY